ncbi:hypothetical protein I1A36_15580 [Pectobacterium aquaticum]|nr:hypothetical protein [Pectobacterium aquaticum]
MIYTYQARGLCVRDQIVDMIFNGVGDTAELSILSSILLSTH